MEIGIIGTGLLGKAIAEKYLSADFIVSVYNRTYHKTNQLAEKGAFAYDSFGSLLKDNKKIALVLSDYEAICSVLFDAKTTHDFTGKTIFQMSTISPNESKLLSERIKGLGGKYIEVPVLGSIPQVKEGKLIVLFGGNKSDFNFVQNALQPISNSINYIGKIGKAAALKLALNQMIASLTSIFSMSLGYVLKNEIDPEIFMKILRESALYAPTFDKKLERMLKDNFTNPNFPVKHLLKDVELAKESFNQSGINSAILSEIKKILQHSIESGDAEKDYSALYNVIVKK